MRKKVLHFFINFAIFWIFVDLLSNISFPSKEAGKLYMSLGFAFVMALIPFVLGFFKFPKISALFVALGIALTFGYFYLLNTYFSNLILFYPTVIGNSDLLFVKIPTLIQLNDINSIFLFSSVILNLCSIILNKQVK